MFAMLYQYLLDHGEVYLQGIGQLQMIAQPAAYDVANQQLLAPRHAVFIKENATASNLQGQMAFISRQLDLSEEEAFELYQRYCDELKNDLVHNKQVNWNGLGGIEKLEDGSFSFINPPELHVYAQPVDAVRVIRRNTAHNMVVGANETTSTAMREMLEESHVIAKKSRWWVAAAIIGALAVVLICLKRFAYL